jgi:ornithine cyclodeaminase
MARSTSIFTETELRSALKLDLACVDVVEQAFTALARGTVTMPPIVSMELPAQNAEVDAKMAFIQGFDIFALKLSTGFFNNPSRGLPSLGGMVTAMSAVDGSVQAVFLDNGYLTDLRTAAAGAVAARHLAPSKVATAGVIGTGLQARMQMQAVHLVRPFSHVLVWGRNTEHAAQCAADISQTLGVEATVSSSIADLLGRSQLVVTTTPAMEPLVMPEWLHPGLHITAMGADAPEKTELAPGCLAAADLYVADNAAQVALRGELREARAAGFWAEDEPAELGQIVIGQRPGRTSADQITIADLTGTGAQDTAIAAYALKNLPEAGLRIST